MLGNQLYSATLFTKGVNSAGHFHLIHKKGQGNFKRYVFHFKTITVSDWQIEFLIVETIKIPT